MAVLIGQLGVEAGPEETWITVGFHQAEDLVLGQLEGGGVHVQTQALIGPFSDRRVHVDLETEQRRQWSGRRPAEADRQAPTCLAAVVEINSS